MSGEIIVIYGLHTCNLLALMNRLSKIIFRVSLQESRNPQQIIYISMIHCGFLSFFWNVALSMLKYILNVYIIAGKNFFILWEFINFNSIYWVDLSIFWPCTKNKKKVWKKLCFHHRISKSTSSWVDFFGSLEESGEFAYAYPVVIPSVFFISLTIP
ncbi:hypothetical protein BH09PAT2_BH09PAT2_03000 [soil metagenome]